MKKTTGNDSFPIVFFYRYFLMMRLAKFWPLIVTIGDPPPGCVLPPMKYKSLMSLLAFEGRRKASFFRCEDGPYKAPWYAPNFSWIKEEVKTLSSISELLISIPYRSK